MCDRLDALKSSVNATAITRTCDCDLDSRIRPPTGGTLQPPGPGSPPRRPPNDLFSRYEKVITGPSGRTTGSNVGAIVETGERGLGSRSVWWRWQSPPVAPSLGRCLGNRRLPLAALWSSFAPPFSVLFCCLTKLCIIPPSMAVKKKTARRRPQRRLIGYAQVSTSDQDLTSQIDALKKHGCGTRITSLSTKLPGLARSDPASLPASKNFSKATCC